MKIEQTKPNLHNSELDGWVHHYRQYAEKGEFASYIPALQAANQTDLGISILEPNGSIHHAGEWDRPFTLQSISKIVSFIFLCQQRGLDDVLTYVDVEPTGDPFNSIIRLEVHEQGKPFNPLINAGAISVCSLLPGDHIEGKINLLLSFFEQLLGSRPRINETVFQSEWETGYRNRALAYFLKETGFLEGDVDTALEVYFRQCAIEINTQELATIGLVLSQNGTHPHSHRQIFDPSIAQVAKALMLTCGMYNASGKYAAFIGIPAKSGVSGGILATVPARERPKQTAFPDGCGIGIYGPSIDQVGNSYAGTLLLRQLSTSWSLNIFH